MKKKHIDKEERYVDQKKKEKLASRRGSVPSSIGRPSEHPSPLPLLFLFPPQPTSAPPTSPPLTTTPPSFSHPEHAGHSSSASHIIHSASSRKGEGNGEKSEKKKGKDKSKKKKGKKGKMKSSKKSERGSGVENNTQSKYTPAPFEFREKAQPPTMQPSAQPTDNPTGSPTPQKTASPIPVFRTSTPTTSPTLVPTPDAAQKDITQIPGLINLTFPPTKVPSQVLVVPTSESPTLAPITVDETESPSVYSPTSVPSMQQSGPKDTTILPSLELTLRPSTATPTTSPSLSMPSPTASPTPDNGIRRIRVEPFYIGFEAPATDRAPTPEEFAFVTQLTTLYFEEIFATLYRDADFSFEMVDMTLLYTGYETSFPEEKFNLYMEFSADVLVRIVNDSVERPTPSDVLAVIFEAVDTTYVVNYIWNSERESPFYRAQNAVAGPAPLKLPDSGTSLPIDTKGPNDKKNVQIVAKGEEEQLSYATEEQNVDLKPVTSKSYNQLAGRFILPGSSIIKILFQNADD